MLEWVRDALDASHADERRDHEEAIKRHPGEYKRLQDRINAMYVDKLDGLVDTAFFEKMPNQWREEQNRCLREIERRQNADKSYKDVVATFRQPFDLLAETATAAARSEMRGLPKSAKNEAWLPELEPHQCPL